MTDDDLTPRERAVLLALMAEARELGNPELERVVGGRFERASRERLNARGLVESDKHGRSYRHLLSEAGWAWCARELSGTRPPRSGVAGGALYAVLAGLHRYLHRRDLRLADVFRPDPEAAVRAAYAAAAPAPGDWVGLVALRQQVAGLPREDVDAALDALVGQPGVHLVPESNQQALTPADRAAAVHVGGQDKHLLAIEPA